MADLHRPPTSLEGAQGKPLGYDTRQVVLLTPAKIDGYCKQ